MARKDTHLQNVVQSTSDYDKFSFLNANRELSRGHIENIKKSFEENGNLTRVQPILVNDKFQIIDGQHRYIACKELDEPIFYTIVPGLGVSEARAMNILHQNWGVMDFAESYATTGNKNYQKYLSLKEEFGFPHNVMLRTIQNGRAERAFKEFREGNFVISDEVGAVERLIAMAEITELLPLRQAGCEALLTIINDENYNQARMVKKVTLFGDMLFRPYARKEDNLKMLEDIYNYKTNAANRVRLY